MRLRDVLAALNPFGPASGDWHSIDVARDSGSRAERHDPEEGLGPKDGRAASEGGIAQGQCHD
jgi:hypothetical protein